MAINTQKFLPPAKGGALIRASQKVISAKKSSSVTLTEKSVQDIANIKVSTIRVESILKGTLAVEKKKLDEKKRKESGKRREKQEEKLETKSNIEKGQIKMPKLPRLGIFDWIKNFIGNIILGYFAVRLIDHLPKIMPIVRFLGSAADFIINVGGKLLNGLVTFVDWGYKAIDATRGFMKNLGGENFAQGFDKFIGAVDTVLFLSTVLATDLALEAMTGGGDGFMKDTVKGGARKAAGVFGRGAARAVTRLGLKTIGKGGTKAILGAVRPLVRNAPLIGGLLEFGISWALGDPLPKAAFRGVGTALLAAVGTAVGGPIGLAIGGYAGGELGGVLYDMFFNNKKPPQKGRVQGKAGGGITRGGKTSSGVKREVGGEKEKGKYKRTLAQKPGKVEITSPGADVGGEDKILGIFPNPLKGAQKVLDAINPFNTIKKSGEELGKTDYFGPILAITAKLLTGQKPNQQDYRNVGLGINLLLAKGIQDKQLKGGVVAAFAEGGLVDPDVLSAAETGGDISNWVAKTFKGEIESNAQRTLRLIKENAEKRKEGDGEGTTPTTEGDLPSGTGSLTGNTNAEKVFNYLIGYGFTEQAAAGVIGNLMQESGVNPKSKQLGGGPGRGIMQWGTGPGSGGRWDALVAWAASSGKDPWQLDTQVEWMMKEMRSYGTLNRLKGVTNVKKAVEIFESEMEKAGVPNYPRRYQYAADALASFGKGGAGGMRDAGEGLGEGGMIDGSGKFIQGNSGASRGVHFHIGPGNQTKGTILQPQYNADARASALKALIQFSGNRSVYLGRSGVSIPKGKKINSSEAASLISNEQRAHTASGSQGGVDLQVDFESKVPFPLKLFGMKYRKNGFGVSADVVGSNSFVAHGRYDEKGRVAPQESMKLYEKGGPTLNRPHVAMLGEKGKEFVIDADSTAAIEETFPGFLGALNQAKYNDAINVLRNFASYEQAYAEPEIIEVPVPVPVPMSGGYQSSGGMVVVGGSGDDPYETLYTGG